MKCYTLINQRSCNLPMNWEHNCNRCQPKATRLLKVFLSCVWFSACPKIADAVPAGISSQPTIATITASAAAFKSDVENRLIVRHRMNARKSGIESVPKLFNNSDIVLGTYKVRSFSAHTWFLSSCKKFITRETLVSCICLTRFWVLWQAADEGESERMSFSLALNDSISIHSTPTSPGRGTQGLWRHARQSALYGKDGHRNSLVSSEAKSGAEPSDSTGQGNLRSRSVKLMFLFTSMWTQTWMRAKEIWGHATETSEDAGKEKRVAWKSSHAERAGRVRRGRAGME